MLDVLAQAFFTRSARTMTRALVAGLAFHCLVAPARAGQAAAGAQTQTAAGQTQSLGGTQTPATETPATPEQTTPRIETPQPERPSPFNIAPAGRVERPYRGLFGMPRTGSEPRLVLESMFGGGLGSNPGANQAAGGPTGGTAGGDGAMTSSTTLSYTVARQKFGIYANNQFITDYYPTVPSDHFLSRDFATLSVYFVPWRPTRVTVTEAYKTLPEFSVSDLFVGGGINPDIPIVHDFGLAVNRYRRYGTTLEVSHHLSKRVVALLNANYGHGINTDGREWIIYGYSANVSYTIDRGLGLFVGYRDGQQRDLGERSSKSVERRPQVNFGIDYSRPLSVSRRTKLMFSTGTAGVEDRVSGQTTYHVIGGVSLLREFGRTWNASVFYSRDVRYIEQLADGFYSDTSGVPLLAHSLGSVVSGSLTKRADLKAYFSGSSGRLGSASTSKFDSYFGSVQLSVGLTRHLALGADYGYTKLVSPPGLEFIPQLNLHSARFYLKLWAPLISVPKRPPIG